MARDNLVRLYAMEIAAGRRKKTEVPAQLQEDAAAEAKKIKAADKKAAESAGE